MKIHPREDCLTSALYGLHYTRQNYSIANLYGDLLDAFNDNEDIELQVHNQDTKSISFSLDGIGVQINTGSILVFTNIFIQKKLANIVDINQAKPNIPDIWGYPFNTKPIDFADSISANRKRFREDAEKIFKVISLILEDDSPKTKFIGYIENYLIPINRYQWHVMDKFDDGAKLFGDVDIHEKKARNRYTISRTDDSLLEKSLIFEITKPYVSPDKISKYASAHFDYQHWINGNSKVNEINYDEAFKMLETELSKRIIDHEILKIIPLGK